MNTANHPSEDDLVLFALQSLPDEELSTAIEHMEHCEICRAEVGRVQGDLVSYAMTADLHSPPAQARERLMRRVGKEKKVIPMEVRSAAADPMLVPRQSQVFQMDSPDGDPARRSSGVLSWAGWAVAAGVALVAGLQFHERQLLQGDLNNAQAKISQSAADNARAQATLDALTGGGAFEVALHMPVPKGSPAPIRLPEAHAAYDAQKGALVFVGTNLESLPTYKTYELWVLPVDPDAVPIPAGTFKPDANRSATLVMPDLPKGVNAKGFGVTIEDEGGAKTPTLPIVLVGF